MPGATAIFVAFLVVVWAAYVGVLDGVSYRLS